MDEYPIRVLSLGAGVQSSTLLRMAIRKEIKPIQHAVFSDTGWEPKAVYFHLETLKGEMESSGIAFHVVSAGNLREDSLSPDHGFAAMPLHITSADGKKAIGRRQCTMHYKLRPLQKKQRELAGLKKSQQCKETRIVSVIGISWDESQRMRDPAFPWIRHDYPLVDMKMTREDCLRWNESNGFALPPRSSCIGCPFHTDKEWKEIRKSEDDWNDAVDFDEKIRTVKKNNEILGTAYLHRSRIPLREVDFRTEEERGQGSLFDMECEGMCGL